MRRLTPASTLLTPPMQENRNVESGKLFVSPKSDLDGSAEDAATELVSDSEDIVETVSEERATAPALSADEAQPDLNHMQLITEAEPIFEEWRTYGFWGKLQFYYQHNGMKQTIKYGIMKLTGGAK